MDPFALQIIFHIVELCVFLICMFFVSQKDSKFIQKQPFKAIALLTVLITILGGIALAIYDIVLFCISL